MISPAAAPSRPTRARLILFAAGDFAFNLFWQSVMLFLLFYYTDAIRLPVETAALTYMLTSIWDGVVNLAAGVVVDRRRSAGGHARWLVIGAVPLGLAFVLMYLPPPQGVWWAAGAVFAGHLLFRTAYAFVNVPYLAMSARVSQDSGDRALIAGLRMLFGTAALLTVTQGGAWIGRWFGDGSIAQGYFAAAVVFACIGAALLVVVGLGVAEAPLTERRSGPSIRECVASLARNRAFLTLNAATMAMIVAATVLNKSVLYYYKYLLGNEAAGRDALGWMGLAGVLAVPVWVVVCRRIGNRATWFLAAAVAMSALLLLGLLRPGTALATHGYLMALQVALTGLNIVFWAMLPNTIEYGERSTGLRVEGTVYGLAALLQRVSIGAATGLLGLALSGAGYVANAAQTPATAEAMRWSIVLIPFAFFGLSLVFMALNPLTRHAHAAIVAELAKRRAEA